VPDVRVPDRRTVANAAGLAVLLLALLFAVIVAVPGLVGAEASYVVTSDSMSPAIDAGDFVVVGPADADALSPGTVVSYRPVGEERSTVTHRIIGVQETSDGLRYRTKGDANEEADRTLVAPSRVVGTVWVTLPLAGHLVAFAGTDLGLLLLVILPATALLASELYGLYRAAGEPAAEADAAGAEPDDGGHPE
jgi:signal peptidase